MKGLFLGLTTIDIQYIIDQFPAPDSKVNSPDAPDILVGGPATNAAVTYSHLGGRAHLVSAFGQNVFNSFLQEDLRKFNIEHHDLAAHQEEKPVISSVVTASENGARTIFTNHPTDYDISFDSQQLLEENQFDFVLLDGFYLQKAIDIACEARRRDIPVILDGGSWKDGLERLLPHVNYAICSEKFMPPWCSSQSELFSYLSEKGIHHMAVTRGGKPILYKEGFDVVELPVPEVKPVDTLGAGDIFHGAFAYYLSRLHDFVSALEKAAEVAAHSCQFAGTRIWMQ